MSLPHTERIAELLAQGKVEEAKQLQKGYEAGWFEKAKQGHLMNLTDLLASAEQLHIHEMEKVHCYGEGRGAAWAEFLTAMRSGEVFECDEEMYFYWLEVLPPVFMARWVVLPNGQRLKVDFGFAEGAEPVTVFWNSKGRFFGCRTTIMNPHA